MSVAATSLITLAQLKVYLGSGFEGNQNDALLELLIDNVSVEFDRFLGRTLAKTTYTAIYLDGNGEDTLSLPNWPVVSVTSLYEDDTLLTSGLDYDYVLYTSESDAYLRKVNATWPGMTAWGTSTWLKGPKTIKLTYTAGYVVQGATPGAGETALPADIKLACMIQVAREWKKTQGAEWGESSRTFKDGSTTRIERGLLQDVEEILVRYRRVGL